MSSRESEEADVWIVVLPSRGGSLYGGSSEFGEVDTGQFRLGASSTDSAKEWVELGDDKA